MKEAGSLGFAIHIRMGILFRSLASVSDGVACVIPGLRFSRCNPNPRRPLTLTDITLVVLFRCAYAVMAIAQCSLMPLVLCRCVTTSLFGLHRARWCRAFVVSGQLPVTAYSCACSMNFVRIVSRFFLKSELCQWVPHSQIFRVNISKSVSGDTIHTRRQEGNVLGNANAHRRSKFKILFLTWPRGRPRVVLVV